jgi:hypothetical protein
MIIMMHASFEKVPVLLVTGCVTVTVTWTVMRAGQSACARLNGKRHLQQRSV